MIEWSDCMPFGCASSRAVGLRCRPVRDVLQQRTMDQLVHLPEADAVRFYFASSNARMLLRMQLIFALSAVVAVVLALLKPDYQRLVAPVIALLVVRLVFLLRDRPIFDRRTRPILLVALVVQPLLVLALYFQPTQPIRVCDFLLLATFLLYRLPVADLLIPVLGLWGATAGRHLLMAAMRQAELQTVLVLALSAMAVAVLVVGGVVRARHRRTFLVDWRRAEGRANERAHFQREINDAKRIQLSMLPPSDPRIPWLDVAGRSVPASEVGGDYYGYFRLAEDRQAIVVADVAGHGLASGLLLSGVRSCLHMMHEEAHSPAEVLGKLNRMVRATTDHRTFVTMIYALLDRSAGTVTVAAAGHPPLYHWHAATGDVTVHGISAPPLGTRLPQRDGERQRTFSWQPGDVIVMLTDGLSETLDARGRPYDDDRLIARLRAQPAERTARETRDALLNDLWRFKGDAEQGDDVTLVVARFH